MILYVPEDTINRGMEFWRGGTLRGILSTLKCEQPFLLASIPGVLLQPMMEAQSSKPGILVILNRLSPQWLRVSSWLLSFGEVQKGQRADAGTAQASSRVKTVPLPPILSFAETALTGGSKATTTAVFSQQWLWTHRSKAGRAVNSVEPEKAEADK